MNSYNDKDLNSTSKKTIPLALQMLHKIPYSYFGIKEQNRMSVGLIWNSFL